MSDYIVITKTRQQRILDEKKKTCKVRRGKVIRYALAGALVTSALINLNSATGKALACSAEYKVQYGDTLYSLAKKHRVTVQDIMSANDLTSDLLRTGQLLYLPIDSSHNDTDIPSQIENSKLKVSIENINYKVKRGDNLFSIAKRYQVSIKDIKLANHLTSDLIRVDQLLVIPIAAKNTNENNNSHPKSNHSRESYTTTAVYKAVAGDTLWGIAQRFNISVEAIKRDNGLKSDIILIDQKLMIQKNNIKKSSATVVGIVDNISIEVLIGEEHKVLQIPYGTASNFDKLIDKKVDLVYINTNRPHLVSIEH
ncbi:LysM peptidoglycan-binding domain-containing protein [Alkalihalobacterium sp. APHAB7]|uniref:LysM peptidoglycan-binding domain-containing protein n=1 Tax=Alkalihalobacterium sp. APHAB7 TaxID=3402081 RepID=UPI003AAE9FE3